jgi:hypothetical protein
MLLVWLYYLTRRASSLKGGVTLNSQTDTSTKIPKFFIYPKKNYKVTVQKAPMAHKTFSQEQYMIRCYVMSISFLTPISNGSIYPVTDINSSVYYALVTLNSLPYFSTNLLWLKKYSLTYLSNDTNFFSYRRFNYRPQSRNL